MEVGPTNVVQIVIDNTDVCEATYMLMELEFSSIYCNLCVVHTLDLALKNVFAAKNTERNIDTNQQCSWIPQIANDVSCTKNLICGAL